MTNHDHKWTEKEREYIRVHYAHTLSSKQTMATKFGVTVAAVESQISRMGICKRTDRHPWTKRDDVTLTMLLPRYSPKKIASMMHRSLNSIIARTKRLKLNIRNRDGWFTEKEVCEILGVEHKWLHRRIENGILPATAHYGQRTKHGAGSIYHIERRALRTFIRRYPDELNGRNVDMLQIVDILAGVDIIMRGGK